MEQRGDQEHQVRHHRPEGAACQVVVQRGVVLREWHHALVRAERFGWKQLILMWQLVPRGLRPQQEQQLAFQPVMFERPVKFERPERGLVFRRLAQRELQQRERLARRELQQQEQLAQQLRRQQALERVQLHPYRLPSLLAPSWRAFLLRPGRPHGRDQLLRLCA